ncbi:MAG: peptidylprolyl isomerase [Acidobacteria bacterium]|nr:peptidylprolyl isomerase [Acidobacteriota bacterium]
MRWQYVLPFPVCALTLVAADVATIEEIIAKINGDIITRTELGRSRRQMEAELRQQGVTGPKLQETLQEREGSLLRDRIDQLLLVQKAKDLNINVESEVSKQLADYQRSLKIPDPEKFQQAIREQTGMPFEDFKSEMRNSMLTERVIRQEVGSQISIPREEVRKFYEEHKAEFLREERVFLAEIFLSTEGKDAGAVAQIEKKAKDVAARAKKGEKFFELARDNSDSTTAQQGGDLGGWKRGELDKELEALIYDKERNFVTDLIRRPNGFLILKVAEKHQAGQASFEEVENMIMNRLMEPLFQPKIRGYLTKLRELAFLEIKPGFLDIGAAPGKDTTWKDPAQLKPETVTKEELASRRRRKRVLGMPVPFTKSTPSSSSKTATMK